MEQFSQLPRSRSPGQGAPHCDRSAPHANPAAAASPGGGGSGGAGRRPRPRLRGDTAARPFTIASTVCQQGPAYTPGPRQTGCTEVAKSPLANSLLSRQTFELQQSSARVAEWRAGVGPPWADHGGPCAAAGLLRLPPHPLPGVHHVFPPVFPWVTSVSCAAWGLVGGQLGVLGGMRSASWPAWDRCRGGATGRPAARTCCILRSPPLPHRRAPALHDGWCG